VSRFPVLGLALAAVLAAPAASRAAPAEDAIRAGVPAPLANEVAARAAEAGVDPAEALAPAIRAARADLPSGLVAAKVLEGLAKGAPPPRVLAVAAGLADRLAEAGALLSEAQEAKLALRSARSAAIADLAAALGEGVPREAVRGLVRAASTGPGGNADAVVAAARTLGDLAHRGVEVKAALPLATALAARPPLPPGQVAALYDDYRREGGRDARPFLEEAERRASSGEPLGGMVDHFGEGGDHVVSPKGRDAAQDDGGGPGQGHVRGASGGAGTVPGLEDGPPGRGRKKLK
jgi:hypothetical protein